MSERVYKLIYLRDDTTGSGLACGEGAAYDLPTATRLVATGVCRIANDEPERETLEVAVGRSAKGPQPRPRAKTTGSPVQMLAAGPSAPGAKG
jgi:hypothetical protein